jgi:hypothetical protein
MLERTKTINAMRIANKKDLVTKTELTREDFESAGASGTVTNAGRAVPGVPIPTVKMPVSGATSDARIPSVQDREELSRRASDRKQDNLGKNARATGDLKAPKEVKRKDGRMEYTFE